MSDGNDILIKAEHVSKKFCLSLKKSLWYGLKDMGKELLGMSQGNSGQLRPKEFWAVNNVSFEVKRVRMHYPRLPLNPGHYSLWLSAACPGYPGDLAVKHGCCPFQMKGHFTGWVPIQAVVDWQAVAQDGSAVHVPPEAQE